MDAEWEDTSQVGNEGWGIGRLWNRWGKVGLKAEQMQAISRYSLLG